MKKFKIILLVTFILVGMYPVVVGAKNVTNDYAAYSKMQRSPIGKFECIWLTVRTEVWIEKVYDIENAEDNAEVVVNRIAGNVFAVRATVTGNDSSVKKVTFVRIINSLEDLYSASEALYAGLYFAHEYDSVRIASRKVHRSTLTYMGEEIRIKNKRGTA